MASMETWAQSVIDKYEGKISRLLGITVPDGYEVRVVPASEIPAGDVSGQFMNGVLYINKDYVSKKNEGMVVHELTHAFLTSAGIDAKPEIVTDWVRYKLGLTTESDGSTWTPSDAVLRFDERAPQEIRQWVNRQRREGSGPTNWNTGDSPSDAGSINGAGGGGGGKTGPNGERAPDGFAWTQINGEWTLVPDLSVDEEDKPKDWEFTSRGEAKAQSAASYRALVGSLGISLTSELDGLINRAFSQEWNQDMFMEALRKTSEYRQRFPGIFEGNGVLKMSEAEYMQAEKLYTSYASQAGVNMNGKRMAFLFRNDVTPDEFADRIPAYARLRRNPQLMNQFKRELVQGGVAKPADVSNNKELFRYLMGEGNAKWHDVWQDTVTRNAAVTAGISFKKGGSMYTSLRQNAIERISRLDLSEEEMMAKFQEVEGFLRTVLPTTEAGTYGVTKKGVTKAVFGGAGSSKARAKLERAVNTAEAFTEDRATSAMYTDDTGRTVTQGVTDIRRRSQSEY